MKTIKIFIALLISSLLTSCLTNKPIQSSVSQVSGETNRIYQVSNPAFKKQVSAIGVAVLIGATAGGAAAMNGASPAMSYDAQGNQTPNSMINLGLGAIAGLGIVSLGNYAGGQGNEKAVTNEKDFAEWTRKYGNKEGKTYIPLSGNRIVPKDAELDWKIDKYEDMITFLQLFPDSKRVEDLAKQSISRVSREQLLSLIDKDLKSKDLSQETLLTLKRAYLDKSISVSQAIEAKNRFSELTAEAEKKATELLASMGDVESFMRTFSDSKYADFVEDKAISFVASMVDVLLFRRIFPLGKLAHRAIRKALTFLTREGIRQTVDAYKEYANQSSETANALQAAKQQYISKSQNISEFFNGVDLYPNVVNNEEAQALLYIKNIDDTRQFMRRFGNNETYKEKGYEKLLDNLISIKDLADGANNFPEIAPKAESKAFLIITKNEHDAVILSDFIKYFPNSSSVKIVKAFYLANANDELANIVEVIKKDELKGDNELDVFLEKYNALLNSGNFDDIGGKDELVNRISTIKNGMDNMFANRYETFDNIDSDDKLVKVKFQTTNGKKASAYLGAIVSTMVNYQSSNGFFNKTYQNNITNIKGQTASKDKGIVMATWYRRGVSFKDALSTGESFESFEGYIVEKMKSWGMTNISCEYLGSYEDDAIRSANKAQSSSSSSSGSDAYTWEWGGSWKRCSLECDEYRDIEIKKNGNRFHASADVEKKWDGTKYFIKVNISPTFDHFYYYPSRNQMEKYQIIGSNEKYDVYSLDEAIQKAANVAVGRLNK